MMTAGTLAIELIASPRDIAATIRPPTLGEAIHATLERIRLPSDVRAREVARVGG